MGYKDRTTRAERVKPIIGHTVISKNNRYKFRPHTEKEMEIYFNKENNEDIVDESIKNIKSTIKNINSKITNENVICNQYKACNKCPRYEEEFNFDEEDEDLEDEELNDIFEESDSFKITGTYEQMVEHLLEEICKQMIYFDKNKHTVDEQIDILVDIFQQTVAYEIIIGYIEDCIEEVSCDEYLKDINKNVNATLNQFFELSEKVNKEFCCDSEGYMNKHLMVGLLDSWIDSAIDFWADFYKEIKGEE